MSTQHTLLLIQFTKDEPMTRTYLDFNTVLLACEGIVQVFEQHLRRRHPEQVSYDLTDLV